MAHPWWRSKGLYARYNGMTFSWLYVSLPPGQSVHMTCARSLSFTGPSFLGCFICLPGSSKELSCKISHANHDQHLFNLEL